MAEGLILTRGGDRNRDTGMPVMFAHDGQDHQSSIRWARSRKRRLEINGNTLVGFVWGESGHAPAGIEAMVIAY
ncbi:hypothetical protein [Dokdonella sp.]|uniref:hypothetical protein n=1 Tax=Dokdonella sp. TaxID=2291710 RepID=UPI003C3E6120